jgi:phospholipid/cholesterol/gamma-HCH transport system substrate-binding protein
VDSPASYFKVGLFVLVALALGVAGVVIIAAGATGRDAERLETYLDESVQGLDVGAKVKYRGVQVGQVEGIGFVRGRYGVDADFVRIVVAVQPTAFGGRRPDDFATELARQVERGLRIRIAMPGITGAAFLELDYVSEPERYPLPDVTWTPEHPVMPSMPSLTRRLLGGVEEVVDNLRDARLDRVGQRVDALLTELEGAVREDVRPALANFREASDRLPGAVERIEGAVTGDLTRAFQAFLADLNVTTRSVEKGLNEFLDRVATAAESTSRDVHSVETRIVTAMDEELKPTLANLRKVSEELPTAAADIRRTVRRLDLLVAGQQDTIAALLRHLRTAASALRDMSQNARKYPAQVLFGEKPAPARLRR